jgi:hypothetical protein
MLENSYYRVSIDGSGLGGAAPADGFIDNKTAPQYAGSSTLVSGGSGYKAYDLLTVSGGTGQPTQFMVEMVDNSGVILTYNEVVIGVYSNPPSNPVSVTGGHGSGATFNLGSYPSNFDNSLAKVRANVRYRELIDQVQLMANGFFCEIDAVGADVNTPPTSFEFTVFFERDEFVQTPDETAPGTSLTGADAVTRCIARALLLDKFTLREVYNPQETAANTNNGSVNFVRNPTVVTLVEAAPLVTPTGNLANDLTTASAAVTVTQIANVDLAQ